MRKSPHLGTSIVLRRAGADAVAHGHPWVWRSAIDHAPRDLPIGTEVRLARAEGEALGRAIFDPKSPIAARVWRLEDAPIDDALIQARVDRALGLRAWLFRDGEVTTAYRLIHGEGDRMPGVVVDRYGDVAVLQLDGEAIEVHRERLAQVLRRPLEAAGVRTLVERAPGRPVHFGPAPPETVTVREHGVAFVVDLARGQKTGAFLDQRENRRRLGDTVRALGAARVLNLFSYAGGFSLHAARAGAKTTSVDVAAAAHATAQASFRAAGVDPRGHEFVAADAFAFLGEAKKRGRTWDVVVSDPPSFAPNEKSVARALAAYRALHRACADVLAPRGVLFAASCSSHIGADAFATTLDDAALGRADMRMLALYGPPEDHPTLPAFPEGRYLKLAVLS